MSLIDEALKRARQEAARQDAAEREARYARVPVYMAPVRRSRPWLLPVVVSVCLAAGVGGGLVIAHRSGPQPVAGPHPLAPSSVRLPTPAPNGRGGTTAAVAETPVVEETAETPEPPSQPQTNPAGGRAEGPGSLSPGQRPGSGGAPLSLPAPVAKQPPAPVPTPVQEPAAEPSPSPVIALPQTPAPEPVPQAPAAEPHSYVREVPVPGGGTVRLNGIAFSAQPVALFGDKVVAPGESVNGFTIVAIEVQRVKLQGPGGATVYVTLK